MIFICINVKAQILSTVANSLFTLPATNPIFTMPTATDVVSINGGLTLQVVISTTQASSTSATAPRLHYNYNNTNIGEAAFTNSVYGTNSVWTDDVSLAQNGNTIFAYVSCRVKNGNNIDIYSEI